MKKDVKKITLDLEPHELKAIDSMAKKVKLNRSVMIRILLFMQMDDDNTEWLIPVAIARGQPPWVYMNEILRMFKKSIQYSASKHQAIDKQMTIEGS